MTESKFMKINGVNIQTLPLNIPLTLPQYPVEVFIKPDDEDLEQFFHRVNDKVVEIENNNYGMVHVHLDKIEDVNQLPINISHYYDEDGVECSEFDDWEYAEHEVIHQNEWTKGMNVFIATRAMLEYWAYGEDKELADKYIRLCYGDSRLYDELVINFN